MLPLTLRSLWSAPAAPDPPVRVWRDWLLVGLVVLAGVIEALVRPDVTWRPVAFALCLVLAFGMLWRRTHPLVAVTVIFTAAMLIEIAARNSGTPPFGLYAMAFALVLPYALCRWASGRDIVIGLVVISVTHVIRELAIGRPSDIIAGFAFFLTASALGIAVRAVTASRRREVEEYRLREREQLARELHDTVAHHVSAIAIQAQAAQVVGHDSPQVVDDALRTIESEASRALAEMRAMVGTLRDASAPPLAPQQGVNDLRGLATTGAESPRVSVNVSGDVAGLPPSIDAAVFRIGQESVTNALRHARGASRIDVRVSADDANVRVDVTDDGAATVSETDAGFGLVGMAERVALLDGTFAAGPQPQGGWAVTAVLPRKGAGA